MNNTRILFVDDEPNITSGLRRMLRGSQNNWEAEYFTDSVLALQRMNEQRFDVVVTDMRMPGMDGSRLLTEVKKRFPQMVRIILSGQSERAQIMDVLGKAHQYLSKPCDVANLRDTISRACLLRDRLTNDELKMIVSGITAIPSNPVIYREFITELGTASARIERIGELVAKDIGLSAKVIQLVSSSFFGQTVSGVTSREAAALLGLDLLREINAHGGFVEFDNDQGGFFEIDKINKHCVEIAKAARKVAQVEATLKQVHCNSWLAGMFHNIGKIILASHFPQQYQKALTLSASMEINIWQAEVEIFGVSHAEVGSYLLGLWGLPQPVVDAVSFYRQPMECSITEFNPLTAVYIANVLCRNHTCNSTENTLVHATEFLPEADLTARISRWSAAIGVEQMA